MIVVKMPFKISKCKSLRMTISFQLPSNDPCITSKIIFAQSSFVPDKTLNFLTTNFANYGMIISARYIVVNPQISRQISTTKINKSYYIPLLHCCQVKYMLYCTITTNTYCTNHKVILHYHKHASGKKYCQGLKNKPVPQACKTVPMERMSGRMAIYRTGKSKHFEAMGRVLASYHQSIDCLVDVESYYTYHGKVSLLRSSCCVGNR